MDSLLLPTSLMMVEPEWTDYNGHLNMAYYNVLFDRGVDFAISALGMTQTYVKTRKLTIYTAEAHVRYVRELHAGQMVYATFQIVNHDAKRIHAFQQLHHQDGWIAATSEVLLLHIDMAGPKVVAFPADIAKAIEDITVHHADFARPEWAGKFIEIKQR